MKQILVLEIYQFFCKFLRYPHLRTRQTTRSPTNHYHIIIVGVARVKVLPLPLACHKEACQFPRGVHGGDSIASPNVLAVDEDVGDSLLSWNGLQGVLNLRTIVWGSKYKNNRDKVFLERRIKLHTPVWSNSTLVKSTHCIVKSFFTCTHTKKI